MDELYKNILNIFDDVDVAEITISIERNEFIIGLQLMEKLVIEIAPKATVLEGLVELYDYLNYNGELLTRWKLG